MSDIRTNYDDLNDVIDRADLLDQVIEYTRDGFSPSEIGRELGLPTPTIKKFITELIEEARNRVKVRVAEAMMTADRRLEWLYRKCADQLQAGFDKEALRLAIMVLERQAKMLGLDAIKPDRGTVRHDWLHNATEGELIKEAERLGIPLPSKFSATPHN